MLQMLFFQRPVLFLSTPSVRRATHPHRITEDFKMISIHALREEGDLASTAFHRLLPYFYPRPPRGGRQSSSDGGADLHEISIHALREEGDSVYFPSPPGSHLFLSTPSARRATGTWNAAGIVFAISIHALREEGDWWAVATFDMETDISIHALREEGDRAFPGG